MDEFIYELRDHMAGGWYCGWYCMHWGCCCQPAAAAADAPPACPNSPPPRTLATCTCMCRPELREVGLPLQFHEDNAQRPQVCVGPEGRGGKRVCGWGRVGCPAARLASCVSRCSWNASLRRLLLPSTALPAAPSRPLATLPCSRIMPDRGVLTMEMPFMRAYTTVGG